jgi:hypothetical protein
MPPHATDCPPATEVGKPSAPQWEVAAIFRLHGETYRRAHPVPPSHQQVMRDLETCRTAQLGGHAERCLTCGCERYAYNACRNRHCPKCQTFTQVQWVEDRKAALLPVPSFHLVFTVPHDLNPLIFAHKRPLLTLRFKATSQTPVQCGQRTLGGQIGCTMVLHTWDQTLGAHVHVHCVIAAGALSANGERWLEADSRFLFPVRALSTVFRGKFCEALARLWTTGALPLPEEPTTVAIPAGFAPLRAQRYAKEWVVYAKPPFAGPEHVLDSVGRSTHRVAIANHRILDVRDGWIRFAYRNRRQDHRLQAMTLDAHDLSDASCCMCYPAASCASGIMASSRTGTRRAPCAAVGNCWASPPIPPHAAHKVWCSGCKRSQVSTSHNVRTVAPGHSCGSRCPTSLYPLPAEELLWRCRSTTRHEPAGASQAAAADTITGSSAP